MVNYIISNMPPQWANVVDPISDANFHQIPMMFTKQTGKLFWNDFIDVYFNELLADTIVTKTVDNRLSRFKMGGTYPYGDISRETWVERPTATAYEGPNVLGTDVPTPECEPDPNCRVTPTMQVNYHKSNRKNKYQQTLYYEVFMEAFRSTGNFTALTQQIIQTMYEQRIIDEYIWMKEVLSRYINGPEVRWNQRQAYKLSNPFGVTATDDSTGREFIKALKTIGNAMTFNSGEFNPNNVVGMTARSDMTLLLKASIEPIMDVETLAGAFNPSYLDFDGIPVILVDDFGTNTWAQANDSDPGSGVVAMLIDNKWWEVRDKLTEFTTWYNPRGLYWNYWLHIWAMYSHSYFHNAVAFYQDDGVNVWTPTNNPVFT